MSEPLENLQYSDLPNNPEAVALLAAAIDRINELEGRLYYLEHDGLADRVQALEGRHESHTHGIFVDPLDEFETYAARDNIESTHLEREGE